MDRFDRTLTHGPLYAAIWKIAWPTMLLNVAGGLQGIVDHLMVGHFVGYQGNAAVGLGWQVFGVFIVFVSSVYGGVGVLIARFAGAGDPERVHRAFSQALMASAAVSLGILTPLGWALAPRLLVLVNATAEVRAEALPYLRILFLFNAPLAVFFLLASALRSAGDARTPMRLSVMMTAVNLAGTVVLVRGLGPIPALGTRGAAVSTVAAGALAAAVAFYLLARRRLVVRFAGWPGLKPDREILGQILRFGLPMGLQSIALHVGSLVLLGYVGSLEASAEGQAVYAVAYGQIFLVVNLISVSLMSAAATVAGQGLGAERPERAARVPGAAFLLGLAANAPLALAFFLAPEPLLGLFGLTEPGTLGLGASLLRYLAASTVFLTAAYVYTGALQGTGDTRGALLITLVSQLAVPIGWCAVLDAFQVLSAGGVWFAIVLGHMVRSGLAMERFRRGHWRRIRIGNRPENLL